MGLPAGNDYVVCFLDLLGSTGGQCYSGVAWNGDVDPTTLPGVTPVAVTAGNTATGIDAQV
jgi:hypothetical protein